MSTSIWDAPVEGIHDEQVLPRENLIAWVERVTVIAEPALGDHR